MNCFVLYKYLKRKYGAELWCSGEKAVLRSDTEQEIYEISKQISEMAEDKLFVCLPAAFSADTQLPNCLLLCGMPEDLQIFAAVKYLFIVDLSDIDELVSSCKRLLCLENSIASASSALYEMLLKRKTMQEIIDRAAGYMENPIVVYDSSYVILFFSSDYNYEDPIWTKKCLESRTIEPEHVKEIEECRHIRADTTESFRARSDHSPYDRLVSSIIYDNLICGNVLMLEINDKAGYIQRRMLPVISQIMQSYLIYEGKIGQKSLSKRSLFLIELLSENSNVERVLLNAAPLGIVFPETYVVECIWFNPEKQYTLAKRTEIRNELKSLYPNAMMTYFEGNLVLITLGQYGVRSTFNNNESRLRTISEKHEIRIGISNIYSSPADLRIAYLQAKECILLYEKMEIKETVCRSSVTSLYSIFNHVSDEKILKHSIHAAIEILKKYDEEKGSSLLETLNQYMLCNQNIKTAIEKLHVHRNTFSYQLRRIVELTCIDLKNSEDMFYLNCSLRAYYYLKSDID